MVTPAWLTRLISSWTLIAVVIGVVALIGVGVWYFWPWSWMLILSGVLAVGGFFAHRGLVRNGYPKWAALISWVTVAIVGILVLKMAIGYLWSDSPTKTRATNAGTVASGTTPSATRTAPPPQVVPEGATLLSDCVVVKAEPMTFPVTAPKGEWSKTYCFPPNMTIEWRVLSGTGHYKMKTAAGEYSFTPEKSDPVNEKITQASFMATGDEAEKVQITLK